MEIKSEIVFANEQLKQTFIDLQTGKHEEKQLKEHLTKSFEILERDAFSGIQIPKKLIPKEYEEKFGKIDNLWKYNLPGAWRLIYTVKKDQVTILSIILEWLPHKDYEKRFKY